MLEHKMPVAMRFKPELVQKIDYVRELENLPTRTAFVERACELYALYILESSKY